MYLPRPENEIEYYYTFQYFCADVLRHGFGGHLKLKDKQLRKLARGLMLSTCLSGMATAAHASTVSEPPDFSNSLASPTLLPDGTDTVNGTVTTGSDPLDAFQFSGLTPGASLTLNINIVDAFAPPPSIISIYSSGNTLLGSQNGGSGSVSVVVPRDGILLVGAAAGAETVGTYSVGFTSGVPEPGTFTGVGLGLAAAALARRRRKA